MFKITPHTNERRSKQRSPDPWDRPNTGSVATSATTNHWRFPMTTKAKNSRRCLGRLTAALLAGAVLFSGLGGAYAGSGPGSVTASAEGSASMAIGSVMVVAGSGQVFVGGARFIAESVQTAADGSILVLTGVSEAVSISLRIVGDSVINATALAGRVLTVSATTAGHILHAGGEVVAFVPNAASQTLMHSSTYHGSSPASSDLGATGSWVPADDRRTLYGGDN